MILNWNEIKEKTRIKKLFLDRLNVYEQVNYG